MMKFVNHIPAWLKNKYGLTLLVFLVWLTFFDHNDLFVQMERRSELRELEKGQAYYTEQIELMRRELKTLNENPASLEKAAREKYFMKKDHEDIFLIEEK